jgi:hypothetical protein
MTWKYTGIVAENDTVEGLGPLNSLSATMPRVFRSRTVVLPDRAVGAGGEAAEAVEDA